MPNFKIGDVIKNKKGTEFIILDIIFGTKNIYGIWKHGPGFLLLKDSYFLINNKSKNNCFSRFTGDVDFSIIKPQNKNKSITTSSCPVCGGELKDKFSEYVGSNIKKCKSCGWC